MNEKNEGTDEGKEVKPIATVRVKALTAQDILTQTVHLKIRWVPVSEWGGGVWIRELTGIERDRFESSLVKGRGTKRRVDLIGSRARLVSMACIQGPDIADIEDGKKEPPNPITAHLLFTPRDVKKLSQLGAKGLEHIAEQVRILSGITEEDEDRRVDDLGNGQSEDSGYY